jgi:hypothetical protein
MYRLAQVISDLEAGKIKHIQVVVIGGSMTAGHEAGDHPGAWPRKLEILLQALWGPESITVTNIARPGGQYNYWLQNFARIVEFGHFNIIIGDFAVNNQVDYDKQDALATDLNKTQYSLLNLLVHLPFRPAVLLVETFRTAGTSQGDAKNHCGQHRKKVDTQWICPQWWMPQTWREQAVRFNSVPVVSYRDAVWPLHDSPPTNIAYYWDGLSHPLFNSHVMMAGALLFGFLAPVRRDVEALLQNYESSDFPVPNLPPLHGVCVDTTTKYLAENGNNDTSRFPGWNSPKDSHCWQYRADSRDKFGWIAEMSKKSTLCTAANHSALFQVNMGVGESTGPTQGTNSVGLQKCPRKALFALLPIIQHYSKSTWMLERAALSYFPTWLPMMIGWQVSALGLLTRMVNHCRQTTPLFRGTRSRHHQRPLQFCTFQSTAISPR